MFTMLNKNNGKKVEIATASLSTPFYKLSNLTKTRIADNDIIEIKSILKKNVKKNKLIFETSRPITVQK